MAQTLVLGAMQQAPASCRAFETPIHAKCGLPMLAVPILLALGFANDST